jgi:hypothetical protein
VGLRTRERVRGKRGKREAAPRPREPRRGPGPRAGAGDAAPGAEPPRRGQSRRAVAGRGGAGAARRASREGGRAAPPRAGEGRGPRAARAEKGRGHAAAGRGGAGAARRASRGGLGRAAARAGEGGGARVGEEERARAGGEEEGEGEREEGRGGELTSGSNSGDHRLQNLGHHGEREVEEGEGGCCAGNPNEIGRGGGGAWGVWGAGGARARPGRAGLGWVGPGHFADQNPRHARLSNRLQSRIENRDGTRQTRNIRQRNVLRHDATPMTLRSLFIHDTDTCHYTGLNLGRKSETGREKRVTPEFGERKEEKNSTPKFRALQTYPP